MADDQHECDWFGRFTCRICGRHRPCGSSVDRQLDTLADAFARQVGYSELHRCQNEAAFETMFACDGWIVAWLCKSGDETTRIEQAPAVRVLLGYLIRVRSGADSVMAVVQLDNPSRLYLVSLRKVPS